ncbi:MAG: tetratricopeptide repeat protein, partial [Planctomycetota bacterium]
LNFIPVSAKEYRFHEVLLKWTRRNWKLVGVIVGVLLLLAGFGIYLKVEAKGRIRAKEAEAQKQIAEDLNKVDKEIQSKKKIMAVDRVGREEKMQHLLESFNTLNHVLFIEKEHSVAEAKKYEVGNEIIQLCYEDQDYQLAGFIAREFRGLSNITEAQKLLLTQQVQTQKNAKLKENKERLKNWEKRLKESDSKKPVTEEELWSFVYEIWEMKEPEIVTQLILYLEEGTEAFLKEGDLRKIDSDNFYAMVVLSFGRIEDSRLGPALCKSLEILYKHIEFKKADIDQSFFILKILKVLSELQYKESIPLICQMQYYNKFFQSQATRSKIEKCYRKFAPLIVEYYSQEIESKKEMSSYLGRGLAKTTQEDFSGALDDFNYVIQQEAQNSFAYLQRGNVKFKLKDFSGAIEDYTLSIQYDPKNFQSYQNRAIVKTEIGKTDEAIQDYDLAIQFHPTPDLYYNRGLLKQKTNHFQEAFEDYSRTLAQDSGDPYAYMNRGVVREKLGDQEGALADYNRAIAEDRNTYEAYLNRGTLKIKKKDFEEAMSDFRLVIRYQPQNPKGYYAAGILKRDLANPKGALVDFSYCIELEPTNKLFWYHRGKIHNVLKNWNEAIKDLEQAIQLDPKWEYPYYERGLSHYFLGNGEATFKDFAIVLQLNPQFVEVYKFSGDIYFEQNNFPEALKNYDQAIQLEHKNGDLLLSRGCVKEQLQDLEGALADFTQALLFKVDPNIYYNRAWVKEKKKDYSGAIEDYTQAIRLDNTFLEAYYRRGFILGGALKQLEDAIQDFTSVLKLNPSHQESYYYRALSFKQKGEFEQALNDDEKLYSLTSDGKILKDIFSLLDEIVKRNLQEKNYPKVRDSYLKMKKYLPANHPRGKSIEQKIKELEILESEQK